MLNAGQGLGAVGLPGSPLAITGVVIGDEPGSVGAMSQRSKQSATAKRLAAGAVADVGGAFALLPTEPRMVVDSAWHRSQINADDLTAHWLAAGRFVGCFSAFLSAWPRSTAQPSAKVTRGCQSKSRCTALRSKKCSVANWRATKRVISGSRFCLIRVPMPSRVAPAAWAAPWRNLLADRCDALRCEQFVEHRFHWQRFAITDKVGLAVAAALVQQVMQRRQMGFDSIVDVGGVDAVTAIANEFDFASLGPFAEPRQEVLIAGAPHEVRSQALTRRPGTWWRSTACSATAFERE